MNTMEPYRKLMLPREIERLSELAYNMWFSWNDDALELFARIDRERWEQFNHNPVRILAETAPSIWDSLSKDPSYLQSYEKVCRQWDDYFKATTWFQQTYPAHLGHHIAYFSAEFGLHESLPIYSGGLGILAGDHCKSASDLGIPLVGIGLLYKKGYFSQKLNRDGQQQNEAIVYDFTRLPVLPAVKESGEELVIDIPLADRTIHLKVWKVNVGRNHNYLLDSDVEGNSPWDRELTSQLYGGNQDIRIAQEIVLGLGGVKALRALGIATSVYHINEGHAAFQAFERIREQLETGVPFHIAVEIIRASSVFTTHTPVPAGHDAFSTAMVEYYFSTLLHRWHHHWQQWLRLGQDEGNQLFNMTHLALRTAAIRNGVSKLHGEVTRDMFRSFHGNINLEEVPIDHITNGVHMPTWLAPELKELFSRYLIGPWQSQQTNENIWNTLELVPTESLWQLHASLKEKMIGLARANISEQRSRNGLTAADMASYLSTSALTIGFARRFATYKRANLIFTDLERLDRLINNPDRPVQFIFAGKAHPADQPGQEVIREIYRISQMDGFRGKIVMLENYDMHIARHLIQGVDVWLNNPRRPYEASGTSGQKAAMNGVINFSVLDGWWEEGYDGNNGWSIEGSNEADWQTQEEENTESIYSLLEQEIIPLYYNHGLVSVPWVQRMKRSIQTLAPVYNTDRMVIEYTNSSYIPTLERALYFTANSNEVVTKVADYKQFIFNNWHHVHFIEIDDGSRNATVLPQTVSDSDKQQLANPLKEVSVTVHYGPVWYKDTVVELLYYEERADGWHPVIVQMEPVRELQDRVVRFQTEIPSHLVHGSHFSVRVRPVSDNFSSSFELPLLTSF